MWLGGCRRKVHQKTEREGRRFWLERPINEVGKYILRSVLELEVKIFLEDRGLLRAGFFLLGNLGLLVLPPILKQKVVLYFVLI